MDWFSTITGAVAGTAAGGGLLGFLGALAGVGARWLQERQRQTFEEKRWAHELALQRLQAELRAAESERERALVETEGSYAGLVESQRAEALLGGDLPVWVNAARALFRPLLTSALLLLVLLIWRDLSGGDASGGRQAGELLSTIVDTLIFSASTAVVWWFGDRAMTLERGRRS